MAKTKRARKKQKEQQEEKEQREEEREEDDEDVPCQTGKNVAKDLPGLDEAEPWQRPPKDRPWNRRHQRFREDEEPEGGCIADPGKRKMPTNNASRKKARKADVEQSRETDEAFDSGQGDASLSFTDQSSSKYFVPFFLYFLCVMCVSFFITN